MSLLSKLNSLSCKIFNFSFIEGKMSGNINQLVDLDDLLIEYNISKEDMYIGQVNQNNDDDGAFAIEA